MRAPLALLSMMLCAGDALCSEQFSLPHLPTEAEIDALPLEDVERRATAMKTVMVLHYLQTETDKYHATRGNYMACSMLAGRLDAPPVFAQLFAALSAEYVSSAEYSKLVRAIEHVCAMYGVDVMAIKFFVDNHDGTRAATPMEISDYLLLLPLEKMFNLPSRMSVSSRQSSEALAVLCSSYDYALQQYKSVTDAESAQKAGVQLSPLLAPVAEALLVARHANSEQLNLLNPQQVEQFRRIFSEFNEAQKRLKEQDFYGNSRLKVIDRCFAL